MRKCHLGECPASSTKKDICCLDCKEIKLCLEKKNTCLQVLRSKNKDHCKEYIDEGNE